jgi:hypothetical protein
MVSLNQRYFAQMFTQKINFPLFFNGKYQFRLIIQTIAHLNISLARLSRKNYQYDF